MNIHCKNHKFLQRRTIYRQRQKFPVVLCNIVSIHCKKSGCFGRNIRLKIHFLKDVFLFRILFCGNCLDLPVASCILWNVLIFSKDTNKTKLKDFSTGQLCYDILPGDSPKTFQSVRNPSSKYVVLPIPGARVISGCLHQWWKAKLSAI